MNKRLQEEYDKAHPHRRVYKEYILKSCAMLSRDCFSKIFSEII